MNDYFIALTILNSFLSFFLLFNAYKVARILVATKETIGLCVEHSQAVSRMLCNLSKDEKDQ